MNSYMLGTAVECKGTFTDPDLPSPHLFDPATVVFKIEDNDGTPTTYTYPTDPEVVRESIGVFVVWWPTVRSGEHCYRFEDEGTKKVANEGKFDVLESCFA